MRLLCYGYQFSVTVLRLPDFSYTLRLRVTVTYHGYELRLRVAVTCLRLLGNGCYWGVGCVLTLRLVWLGVVVGDGIGDNIWVK